jgi:methyl-accepting chemotaxis protein
MIGVKNRSGGQKMKIKSIRNRLLVILLPFFILAFGIMSGISYYLSDKALTQSVDETAAAIGNDYSNRILAEMQKLIIILEDTASTQRVRTGDRSVIVATMAEAQKKIGILDMVNYIYLDGSTIRADGTSAQLGDREYFKQVVQTKQPYISEPLIVRSTGKISVNLAVPITNNGQLVGVMTGTYSLEKMSESLKDLKFKETGYGGLADDNGLLLAHPKMPNLVGKLNLVEKKINPELKQQQTELDDRLITLFKKVAESGKQAQGQYVFVDGVERIAVYTAVNLPGGQRWVMMVAAPAAEVSRETTLLGRTMLGISLTLILLAVLFILIVSGRFAKPIQLLRDECLSLAQGDFRKRELKIDTVDEIGQLAQGFREMRVNLQTLVGKVQVQTDQVAASAEELNASAEQSAQAANQVAQVIINVANGSGKQLAAVDSARSVAEGMEVGIRQVADNSNAIAATAAQSAGAAQEGGHAVEKAVSQMGTIEKTVTESAQVVAKLGERSKEIGQIIATISGIAGQTNLLALNAAIEAARAGEQGKGFAVVAEEVRKLAEQSETAAKQIADLIGEIQKDTDSAVSAMAAGTKEVRVGAEVVNLAGQSFGNIFHAINEISGQMKEISATMDEVARGSRQIVTSVQDVDALSKEIAAESQTVSAATEEQSATTEEIASASHALAKMAEELSDAASKFKV